jgi:hypothetical protein
MDVILTLFISTTKLHIKCELAKNANLILAIPIEKDVAH